MNNMDFYHLVDRLFHGFLDRLGAMIGKDSDALRPKIFVVRNMSGSHRRMSMGEGNDEFVEFGFKCMIRRGEAEAIRGIDTGHLQLLEMADRIDSLEVRKAELEQHVFDLSSRCAEQADEIASLRVLLGPKNGKEDGDGDHS